MREVSDVYILMKPHILRVFKAFLPHFLRVKKSRLVSGILMFAVLYAKLSELADVPGGDEAGDSHDDGDDGEDSHPFEGLGLLFACFIKFSDCEEYDAGDEDCCGVNQE